MKETRGTVYVHLHDMTRWRVSGHGDRHTRCYHSARFPRVCTWLGWVHSPPCSNKLKENNIRLSVLWVWYVGLY